MTYEIFNTNTAEVIATARTEAEALAIATAAGATCVEPSKEEGQ